ncbi:hypothetical protein Pelo_119 [Pelomyxa schiedti]|nr:hypothetical protein Pelo_119 [Pelomyxa schiedti]
MSFEGAFDRGLEVLIQAINNEDLASGHTTVLVEICGGSCSGKTYLSSLLSRRLTDSLASVVTMDSWFRDASDPLLPRELPPSPSPSPYASPSPSASAAASASAPGSAPRPPRPSFDQPGSYHCGEFAGAVRALVGAGEGGRGPVWAPRYDVMSNTRVCDRGTLILHKPVIIAEGLYAVEALKDIGTLKSVVVYKVFVAASTETRLQRRKERDCVKMGVPEQLVEKVFYSKIEPPHVKFIEPQKALCNFVLWS